jgi:hypothetical protein
MSLAACDDTPAGPGAARRAPPPPPRAALAGTPILKITTTDLGTLGTDAFGENRATAYGVNDYGVLSDVQPGLSPNVLPYGVGGYLPVALLTTAEADAREIDPAVLTLGDERGTDTPVARGRDGRPMSQLTDVDGDGDLDLLVHFDQTALERNGDLTRVTTQLVLTGDLGDGRVARGSDRVMVR